MSKNHRVAKRPADIYKMLDALVKEHHTHLCDADIIIVWRSGWKSDKDGKLILGQCRKAADFNKALEEHDFAILLNEESWARLDEKQRVALLDHELCHAGITVTKKGETKYRVRKHDLEEFRAIVQRHGIWKEDIQKFIDAATSGPSLFTESDGGKTKPKAMGGAARSTN